MKDLKKRIGLAAFSSIPNDKRIGLDLSSTSSKIIKTGAGFTLIELMVGIAIIITATTVVLSIIVSSFRISGKNTASDRVRQNGNYAIAQISRMVQFADEFEGVSSDGVSYSTTCTNASYNHLKIKYQGTSRVLSCSGSKLNLDGVSILENKISVDPTKCVITCYQDADSSPILGVSFDLFYGDPDLASEKTSKLNFSTRIKMRNN